ncbi:MAG: fucose isomerase [Caldilineaceae bacterium]|nr:fucose isomerase [Caldilineaceae bacterium]MBP8109004.1 fucose isomerase [Caldilineaceae bacterium]MBP8124435.1 fucose isomerase [Caldilineaceae bacterium]MBP9073933.1 fucose isomerase [Caldilineaceae bacterium]
MTLLEKTPTFGLIVATRGFFNAQLAVDARTKLLAKMDKLGYAYIIPPVEATPNGAIESYQDAKICAGLFKQNREEIDGILAVLPNFGDEQGVVQTIDMAKLNVPVMIVALDDEDPTRLGLDERRDAFCGKLSVTNNLYQYGIPFTNTTYHSYALDSEEFVKDMDFFARVCRVVKGLSTMRVGAIGARPAAFNTVRYSEKLLQSTGITTVTVDLSEMIASANRWMAKKSPEMEAKLAAIKDYGTIPTYVPDANIVRQAAWSIAVDQWIAENEIHASAIQCWTALQLNFGCATCLSMSMMGERGMPSACEVDVTGAVSMYALLLASGNPPGFLDWNNNYLQDRNKVINTHCSNYPKSFVNDEIEISNLDVIGVTVGPENAFGAIKAKVAPGPMTLFRMSTDDRRGLIKSYVGEGDFTDDPVNIHGGVAICDVPNFQNLMKYLTKNGYEHHVAMTRGRYADVLEEAVSTYLKWDLYRHQ